MKKFIFIIFFLLAIIYSKPVFGSDTNETIKEQETSLGISDFIAEASCYTKSTFQDIDLKDMYKSAISGNLNTGGILNGIFAIVGKEVQNTIKTLGYILIIVIVHSIIKNISEGLGNGEIGEITYYVQYILIVTLIMTNFSDIIVLIKETVSNLVGFLNSLLPILIALMITTGNIVTTSTVEPILLMIITFVREYDFFSIYTINIDRDITWYYIKNF